MTWVPSIPRTGNSERGVSGAAAAAAATNVRAFDGTDDKITCAGTGTAVCNGAFSLVALVKPDSLNSGDGWVSLYNTNTLLASIAEGGSAKVSCFTAVAASESGSVVYTEDVWNLVAVTKASGSVQARTHQKILGSGSWTHAAGGDAFANNAAVCNRITFGETSSTFKDGRIAVAALFGVELSDAQIESIQTSPATATLAGLTPVALWQFNQASTATAVQDTVGAADESALVGTSVVTDDPPTGWAFT